MESGNQKIEAAKPKIENQQLFAISSRRAIPQRVLDSQLQPWQFLVNPGRLPPVLHLGPNAPVSRKQGQLQGPLVILPLVMPVHASWIRRKRSLHREDQSAPAQISSINRSAPTRSAVRETAKSISRMATIILPAAKSMNGGICSGAATVANRPRR
jgi:hypothetical protein